MQFQIKIIASVQLSAISIRLLMK